MGDPHEHCDILAIMRHVRRIFFSFVLGFGMIVGGFLVDGANYERNWDR
jgi:hypothetical protein